MGLLSFFGFGSSPVKEALRRGAVIIDVRTPHEYDQGKIPGSVNIPVDRVNANAERIKHFNKPVVFCCASGMRSSQAVRIMKSNGLQEVHNGGNWMSLLKKINSL